MLYQVTVLDHRLDHSYRNVFGNSIHPMLLEAEIAEDLKVNDNYNRVFLMGKPGAKISTVSNSDFDNYMIYPSLILLDVGTNDLAAGQNPVIGAEKLFDLGKDMHTRYGCIIGFCQFYRVQVG